MTTIRVCVTDSKKKITRTTTTQKPTQFDRGKEDKTPNHMRFDTCVCVCVCVIAKGWLMKLKKGEKDRDLCLPPLSNVYPFYAPPLNTCALLPCFPPMPG